MACHLGGALRLLLLLQLASASALGDGPTRSLPHLWGARNGSSSGSSAEERTRRRVPAWAPPGLGTDCYGIWTGRLTQTALDELLARLEDKGPAGKLLIDRVMRGQCPYGTTLPGSVSWRGSVPKELHEIVAPLDVLSTLGVIWSFVPYVVVLLVVIDFFRTGYGIRQLLILIWLLLVVTISEGIVKRLIAEPRPGTLLQTLDYTGRFAGSCVPSCGMPSSHSAIACGCFTLLFLDASVRVHPRPFDIDIGEDNQGQQERRRNAHTVLDSLRLIPWMNFQVLSHAEFLVYCMAWTVLLLPVPAFRVILYDHTAAQALAGSFIGLFLALVWFRVMRFVQRRACDKDMIWVFKNNYRPPTFCVSELRENELAMIRRRTPKGGGSGPGSEA